jgi:predicted DNA-binding transcriptional regulator
MTKQIVLALQRLGLTADEVKIYLALCKASPLTAQEIAQATGIPKTTIYRRITDLRKQTLVEERLDEHTTRYQAVPPDTLPLLLSQKQSELQWVEKQMPFVVRSLSGLVQEQAANPDPTTKIMYFSGRAGIRRMAWNILNAKQEVVGYSYRVFSEIVGARFALDFSERFEKNGMRGRDLYSDTYLKSTTTDFDEPNTRIPDVSDLGMWSNWESRYIPSSILDINYQMDIYGDVVAMYNWHDGDVFGVEIHQAKIAQFQRQVFEVLWGMGKE